MSASEPELTALELPLSAECGAPGGVAPLENEVIELFDEMRTPLLRYVWSFGLAAHDGEDVVQEVFLALYRHLLRRGSRANLRGWLFRVAHNLALKRRELNGREGAELPAGDVLMDPEPDPEARFATAETDRNLRAVLRALPERDQRCLALRAEGLRYREIAEILEMSLGAVSISLARSLARLARRAGLKREE